MNKQELITAIAEKGHLTKVEAKRAIEAFTETIAEELKKGEKVQLVGFGTFEARERKARVGVNPRNPEEKIQIAACKAPVFKAGKLLKDKINK